MRAIHSRGGTFFLLLLLLLLAEGCAQEQTPLAGTSNPETYFTQAAGTVIARITQTAEGSGANPTETIPEATAAATEIQLPTSLATLQPQLSETSNTDSDLSSHSDSAAPAASPALQPG